MKTVKRLFNFEVSWYVGVPFATIFILSILGILCMSIVVPMWYYHGSSPSTVYVKELTQTQLNSLYQNTKFVFCGYDIVQYCQEKVVNCSSTVELTFRTYWEFPWSPTLDKLDSYLEALDFVIIE